MPLTKEEIEKIEEEERVRATAKFKYSQTIKENHKNTTYGVPALLSFFIPGLGQIIKGQVGKGVSIFIFFIIGCFCFVVPGAIIWIWQLFDAYNGQITKENNPKSKEEFILKNDKHEVKSLPRSRNFIVALIVLMVIVLLITLFAVIGWLYCWYLVPLFLIWLVWRKTNLAEKEKIIATAFLGLIIVLMPFYFNHLNRSVIIKDLSPTDGFSIQSDKILIKGSIDPSDAAVKINNIDVPINNGLFEYEAILPNEENDFTIYAINRGIVKTAISKNIKINRIFTKEEIQEREQAAAEAKATADAEWAKEKAAEQAWLSSSAGKACTAHPEWTKLDCERLTDNKIWIGMSIDMLKYRRGLPNSANPSDYGNGRTWQWCWYDYKPMCFYGDDDGIIDSYN